MKITRLNYKIMNTNTKSTNWRKIIRSNNQKSYVVIGLFFLVYFFLGIIVDLLLNANHYPNAPLMLILRALLTGQIFPFATLIMLFIAGVSLLITFVAHNKLMLLGTEYHEVTKENAQSIKEEQLYHVVEEMQIAAGLQYMPKVFIIDAPYMNAFASGFSEKSAMVAITNGLLEKLTRSELQAVMAHELSHIRHMDIKLTLLASVLANLILIVLDFLFYSVLFSNREEEDRPRNNLVIVVILLRYILPTINIILILYLSRRREYMADAGCVELMRDNAPLANALLKIANDHKTNEAAYTNYYTNTAHENVRREAYIFDPSSAGILQLNSISDLFSTHPSIQDRLKALGYENG